jgi:redox-sensitive bicupin YhaK (pirin superfamily)
MQDATKRVRAKADIPVFEGAEGRYTRHLAALVTEGQPVASSADGFGALRVFDDILIVAGASVHFGAHDGFEAVVYVLEGECLVDDGRGGGTRLQRDGGVYARLGQGIQHHLRNASNSAPLRVLVAVTVAPQANPSPSFVVGSFPREGPDLIWLASDDPEDHEAGALLLGAPIRLGIATLDPGLDIEFSRAVGRGLYVSVIEGTIELGSGFVQAGGDARLSLENLSSPARIQGVTRACVVVADVALGFAQQLD